MLWKLSFEIPFPFLFFRSALELTSFSNVLPLLSDFCCSPESLTTTSSAHPSLVRPLGCFELFGVIHPLLCVILESCLSCLGGKIENDRLSQPPWITGSSLTFPIPGVGRDPQHSRHSCEMLLIKWAIVRAFSRMMLADPRSTCHPSWEPKDSLEKGHLLFSFRHLDHHWSKLPWKCQQLMTAMGEGQGLMELPVYAMRQASWRGGGSADPFQATECLSP